MAVSVVSAEGPKASSPRAAQVAVPVADLRKEPSEPGTSRDHDPLEESQLLYGEPVRVFEETDDWARVEAPEQQEWSHHQKWEGYPGWVRKTSLSFPPPESQPLAFDLIVTAKLAQVYTEPAPGGREKLLLSIGSRLMDASAGGKKGWRRVRLLDKSYGWVAESQIASLPVRSSNYPVLRSEILRTARSFLGDPYYWGGRSAYSPGATAPPHRGVDCSGLTELAYQGNGITIPRDAHEQWMKAQEIRRDQLKTADLVFLSDPKDPRRITHVMLYAGDGRVVEGPGTGEKVREIPLEDRLKETGGRKVFYGTYLP